MSRTADGPTLMFYMANGSSQTWPSSFASILFKILWESARLTPATSANRKRWLMGTYDEVLL